MSISEDQPAGKPNTRGSGGTLQSKHVTTDTEGNDKRDESEQAPALEAANESSE